MLSPTYWMYDVIKLVQIYNSKLSTHMILTIMMMEATHVPIYIQIELALLGIWTPNPLVAQRAKNIEKSAMYKRKIFLFFSNFLLFTCKGLLETKPFYKEVNKYSIWLRSNKWKYTSLHIFFTIQKYHKHNYRVL